MIITEIKMHNFGLYKGEHIILPSTNPSCPITLIGGMNGGGKTSILEGVLLALYGKRSPRLPKKGISFSDYLRQLVHHGENNCSIEVQIEVPDTHHPISLRILRSWSAEGLRSSAHLEIWQGEKQDPYLAEHWDSFIEDLLPSAIAELFFFDGEQISTLAETDNTLETLSKAIRSLLGVEVIDRLIRDLFTVMSRNRRMIQGSLSNYDEQLNSLLEQNERLLLELDALTQERASLNNKLIQEKRRVIELDDLFYGLGGDLVETRKSSEARQLVLEEQLQQCRTSMGIIASGALPLVLVGNMLEKLHRTVENDMNVVRARMTLPEIEKVIRDVKDSSSDEHVTKRLSQHLGRIQKMASKYTNLSSPTIVEGVLKRLVDSTLKEERTEAREVITAYKDLMVERDQLERNLHREVDEDEIQQLINKRNICSEQVFALEKSILTVDNSIGELKNKLDNCDREVTKLGMQIAGRDERDRIIQYAARTREILRSFRIQVTKQKIADLTNNITHSFQLLTHKTTLVRQVDVDADTLSISLVDLHGEDIPKSSLSSGERQMLAISILWSLGQTSGRMLPIIIDTPMGRLDSEHRIRFVKEYLPKGSHQVIVLSTDTELDQNYLNEITNFVGQQYFLKYNNENRCTVVTEGYFQSGRAVTRG